MKTSKRNVTPQWVSGFNLTEFSVVTRELEEKDLKDAMERGLTPTILRLFNGAIHINRTSAACCELIEGLDERKVDKDGKKEKLAVWKERNQDAAKVSMVEKAKAGITVDFMVQLEAIAAAERGEGKVTDPILLAIRDKWEGSDKKSAFLSRLGLPQELVTASAKEVEEAYLALGEVDL